MKKLLVIFAMLGLIFGNTVFATTCADNFECKEPYDLTPGYSRFFSKITGNKFLTEKIAQSVIRKNIKKSAQGNFSVKLKTYSARDMRAGRFQSFALHGKNVTMEDVYLSEFNLKTICNFNYIYLDKDWNMTVMEDMPMTFDIVVTQDDLNKTMQSKNYVRLLNDVNKLGGGIFSINSSSLKIKHDKIYYILKIAIPFVKNTQDVVICAGLKVENGNIKFANATIMNKDYAVNVDKLTAILNYVNPLDFSVKVLENKDAKVNIKNVSVANNRISVDGTVVLLKEAVK